MKKIGVVRGLYYYELGDIWETMLKELGCKVVLSPVTNEKIIEKGCQICSDGACLPIKAYHGLVTELLKTDVDAVFLPRVVKPYNKAFTCPKVIGVNDMIRASIKTDVKLLEPEMRTSLLSFCFETGVLLGASPKNINSAYEKAKGKSEAVFCLRKPELKYTEKTVVAVTGHPYLLYDKGLNMGVTEILKSLGCEVIMRDGINRKDLHEQADSLVKRPFWITSEQNLGFINMLAKEKNVDGVVCLSSFGCGPDSFLSPFLNKSAENAGIAFCELFFDEHSGIEGVKTRLEAFVDLIKRKKGVYV